MLNTLKKALNNWLNPPVVVNLKFSPTAIPPMRATSGAAGFDLFADLKEANATITIPPMGRAVIPCGFEIELPDGYEAQIRSRSGLARKQGIVVLNSPGTIDSDYRGPVEVILFNTTIYLFTVSHGDRIAQMIIKEVPDIRLQAAEKLSETERGAGGFGSTGVRGKPIVRT